MKNSNYNGNRLRIFKFLFCLFMLVAVILLIIFSVRIFHMTKNQKISKQLAGNYQVSTLYANDTTYSASFANYYTDSESTTPFVIGLLKIDKIDLNYSILSSADDDKDLMDVSLCRFAGPMPNEVGNLCIAGHNYVDYKFFSRLNELERGDKIKLYDLNGKMVEYVIFNMYEVKSDDLSCTSQNTNGKVVITLLTCNNVSGNRLVVVARPV